VKRTSLVSAAGDIESAFRATSLLLIEGDVAFAMIGSVHEVANRAGKTRAQRTAVILAALDVDDEGPLSFASVKINRSQNSSKFVGL